VPGQSPPATGSCRFGRPLNASALALEPQNGPERRASRGSNERNFLSLIRRCGYSLILNKSLFGNINSCDHDATSI